MENKPDKEQLLKAIETAQAAQKAQSTANDLKTKAQAITDPKQREKLLKDAFDKEIEAHGHSKAAKRMQSGTWQGLGFGGGIGAATGMGLGAGVGTLLGAVTAVPTTGLGMLIGSGVGAIHGPWVKLGGGEKKFEDAEPEEVVDALEQERDAHANADLEQRITAAAGEWSESPDGGSNAEQMPRRKPRKLEIRSQKSANPDQSPVAKDVSPKSNNAVQSRTRKPKKLEIRSGKSSNDTCSYPGS